MEGAAALNGMWQHALASINDTINIIPIAGMPPHHRKTQNSNFIIGTFTLPEDGQVMTETCRRFRNFKRSLMF